MEYVERIEVRPGCDVGYHDSNLHPSNGEGRVGKSGIDKNYTLEQMIDLAYRMEEKPNIIIKAGKNAKWYLKKFDFDTIEDEINNQSWRDLSRCVMYIIVWNK
jgi:hypothetical protein